MKRILVHLLSVLSLLLLGAVIVSWVRSTMYEDAVAFIGADRCRWIITEAGQIAFLDAEAPPGAGRFSRHDPTPAWSRGGMPGTRRPISRGSWRSRWFDDGLQTSLLTTFVLRTREGGTGPRRRSDAEIDLGVIHYMRLKFDGFEFKFCGVQWETESAGPMPVSLRHLVIPHWLLAVLLGLFPAVRLAFFVRARRRPGENECAQCGCGLGATPGRCPECGYVPNSAESST